MDFEALCDDLFNGHARAEAAKGVLEHDLHVAAQRAHLPLAEVVDVPVLEGDPPFGLQQPHYGEGERGFA